MGMTRREFLKVTGAAGMGAWLTLKGVHLWALEPADDIENPLGFYPDRDWEKIYRDQYRYDRTFSWVCSPNDTHACRALAYVRNGIVFRMGSEYNYQTYADLYGNKATPNWNPRQCAKGFTFHRLVYGPYRLKHPIIRRGWRQWADDGFPELTQENKAKYKFDSRGLDHFEKISWDDVYSYIGQALISVARRYSGEDGRGKLLAQGYPKEMVDAMAGAGTRTIKMRGGMGLLGVFGKYGMYRLCNTLALLDCHVRGVDENEAKAGRAWSNYTWHGDQAPGHPWVHGLQNADCDFNDLRSSKLIIQDGKNLCENKLTDSHWFIECMERGAKLVTISPEYSPPASKSDYWIPIRPQTDAALFLGITRYMMDQGWYDKEFVLKFTDFPLLIRTDNLKRLRAHEVIPGYKLGLSPEGPSFKYQGLKQDQYEKLGNFIVWDLDKNQPAALTRDDVGDQMAARVQNPALEGTYTLTTVDGHKIEVMTLFSLYKIHLKDYDLDTVVEITHAPKDMIIQLAKDLATIKPAALHQGEGINHWFHATEMNRAAYLPLMLTGNIGQKGAGVFGWAGNYKAALFQGSPWTGPGFKGWVAEDPFHPDLDPQAHGKDIKAKAYFKDEEPAYWNHGEKPLIVETPQGRKVLTGATHMPTPTKVMMFTNVNLINNAKHCYDMIKNVNPNVEMIVSIDIQMTASIEYADIALPANSWLESEGLEVTASCSNPFLQIWKGGIPPVFDSRDDLMILAQMAEKLGQLTGDKRFNDYWKFALEGKREVYIQRLLDSSTTTTGYRLEEIMAGKFGPSGGSPHALSHLSPGSFLGTGP